MTVAFDATFLLYLFREPGTVAPPNDAAGAPIPFAKERVAGLLAGLQKTKTTIIVPTPALSEIMVRAGVEAGQQYLALMARARVFRIVPFDTRAAIETAVMHGHAVAGEKGKSATTATHAKLKYDRQIVAIAKVDGAHTFYTDDLDQKAFAEKQGMTVRGLGDLPVPTETGQHDLFAFPGSDDDDA